MARSFACDNCGKSYQRGHRVSHAKNRMLRRFKPNLHWKWVMEEHKSVRRLLCTRCIRKAEKAVKKPAQTTKSTGGKLKPLAFATV